MLKHFIWTPFNLGLYDHAKIKTIVAKDKWMNYRIPIFEKYTLQSIISQTNQNFKYTVFVDNDTPKTFVDRIDKIIDPFDNVFIEVIDYHKVPEAKWKMVFGVYDHMIQTRIDNDDLIRNDFVDKLQRFKIDSENELCGMNFPLGYCYDLATKKIKLSAKELSNPFVSIRQKIPVCKEELFSASHDRVAAEIKTYQMGFDRMWVRIIHDMNEANSFRGDPVNRIEGDFGCQL